MAKDNGQQQTYGKCQLNRWQSQFQTNDQRAAARMCGIVHMYTTFGTAINRIFAPIFSLILFPAEHMPKSEQRNVYVFTFATFKIKVFWHFIRCRMFCISFGRPNSFNETESVCVCKKNSFHHKKKTVEPSNFGDAAQPVCCICEHMQKFWFNKLLRSAF